MIFLGDLACPEDRIEDFLNCLRDMQVFNNETIVLNLEGAIVDNVEKRKRPTLYNISRITEAFPQASKIIFSLANNHMYDYPNSILETKELLEKHGIGTFGLMDNGTIVPYEYTDKLGKKYAFFGHCWRIYTQVNPNKTNNIRIVDCRYPKFLDTVSHYKSKHLDTNVYCFMHWNYDLEVLPFPLLRSISKQLVDSGVDAVIGSHSHLPQGIEIYKGKIIAYCLGNFYLPSGVYFGGTLTYPARCKRTYGIKFANNTAYCVWFSTDQVTSGDVIQQLETENLNETSISFNNQFSEYDDKKYITYFSKYRVNKLLVPVFGRYNNQKLTDLQEIFAIYRIKIIKALQRIYKGDKA